MLNSTERRRIVLASIDPWRGEDSHFRPFDYGVRRVAAAIAGTPELAEHWEITVLSRRDDDQVALLRDILRLRPHVLGLSTYVWSLRRFLEIAAGVRAEAPSTLVLLGGPSARPSSFAREPLSSLARDVDALVLGDGEDVIRDILALPSFDRERLASVPGVAVRGPLGWRGGARAARGSLDELPSPYQLGLVPPETTAHLEIFRGCPLHCTFCQWGRYDGERTASAAHLIRELDAISRHDPRGVFLVDAGLNLNASAFRALVEAESQTRVLARTSLHCELYPTYVRDEHLELLASTKSHVGIGIQSLDPEVLRQLRRTPGDLDRITTVIRRVTEVADVMLEIIVGLPGDSPDGVRRTLDWARSFGCSVNAYHCLVLPDALLETAIDDDRFVYDPISFELRRAPGWSEAQLERTIAFLGDEVRRAGGERLDGVWHFPRERQRSPG